MTIAWNHQQMEEDGKYEDKTLNSFVVECWTDCQLDRPPLLASTLTTFLFKTPQHQEWATTSSASRAKRPWPASNASTDDRSNVRLVGLERLSDDKSVDHVAKGILTSMAPKMMHTGIRKFITAILNCQFYTAFCSAAGSKKRRFPITMAAIAGSFN